MLLVQTCFPGCIYRLMTQFIDYKQLFIIYVRTRMNVDRAAWICKQLIQINPLNKQTSKLCLLVEMSDILFSCKEVEMSVINRYLLFMVVAISTALAGIAAPVAVRAETGGAGVPVQTFVDEGGLSSEYITSKVDAAGFTDVYYVAFEHGLYDIKARSPDGQYVGIRLDPKTGELVKDPGTGKIRYKIATRAAMDGAALPWEDIISQIKAEGYEEVYAIHYDHQLYEIMARDAQNRVFELYINPNTGQILRHPTTHKPLAERLDK